MNNIIHKQWLQESETKKIKLPTQIGDNDYGRPPGTATTMAGPSLAPTPVPNQHRRSPHHQNDDGATNLMLNTDACQVDNNPPRFDLIESDDKTEDPAMTSEELESEELPPAAEAMPTMS